MLLLHGSLGPKICRNTGVHLVLSKLGTLPGHEPGLSKVFIVNNQRLCRVPV